LKDIHTKTEGLPSQR